MNLESTESDDADEDEKKGQDTPNALKEERLIQIGWIHRTSKSQFTQVRTGDGGGTRKVLIDKEAVKSDILEVAKSLFFPNGVSSKGPLENFVYDIWDFARNKMPETVTVGKMYEKTCLSLIRYYLYTESKVKEKNKVKLKGKKMKFQVKTSRNENLEEIIQSSESSDELPSITGPKKKRGTEGKDVETSETLSSSGSNNTPTCSTSNPPVDILRMAAVQSNIIDEEDSALQFGPFPNSSVNLDETIPLFSPRSGCSSILQPGNVDNLHLQTMALPSSLNLDETSLLSLRSDCSILPSGNVGNLHLQTMALPVDSTSTAVTANMAENSYNCELQNVKKTVRVHRGQVFENILDFFQKNREIDPNIIISIEMLLPDGQLEAAEDTGGVMRDFLTEFWKDFYQRCTTGGAEKIPYLRHDFDEERWKAIGKVIVLGWRQEGYFPIEVSRAFMEQCLYGGTSLSLVDAFLNIVSATDKEVLKMAMADFSSINEEELIDILDNYDCKFLPTANNCTEIINQLAHKAIVQEPNFVIDTWNSVFRKHVSNSLSKEKLDSLYKNLEPTPRKVIGVLEFPNDMNTAESTVSKHLQRFIKDLDKQKLSDFLRFVTGSNLLVREKISVRFVELQGLARRPVAHTCGCVLELPRAYANYPDFKTEFLSVLESSVWVMDIV